MQLDDRGNVTGRMRCDHGYFPIFALTADGHLYSEAAPFTLTLFNVAAGSWVNDNTVSVNAIPQPHYAPLGADGVNLVYHTAGADGGIRTIWFAQPASGH